jgi:two-component system, cell cycle response regulator
VSIAIATIRSDGNRALRAELLGRQLREAIGEDGVAYRVGGDEFAVPVDGEREQAEPVSRRASEALTAVGDDFELGAAWGSAAIPSEAGTQAGALQLADVRMYAQKQSRRLSREGARARHQVATAD